MHDVRQGDRQLALALLDREKPPGYLLAGPKTASATRSSVASSSAKPRWPRTLPMRLLARDRPVAGGHSPDSESVGGGKNASDASSSPPPTPHPDSLPPRNGARASGPRVVLRARIGGPPQRVNMASAGRDSAFMGAVEHDPDGVVGGKALPDSPAHRGCQLPLIS